MDSSFEVRCDSKLHGQIIDGAWFEVRCRSRWCGYQPGVVVLHRFSLTTGERTTKRYRDPVIEREEVNTR